MGRLKSPRREPGDVSEDERDRTTITTYVPRYQKDRWSEHADELDMSLSEFVRTMVQAGRSGFDVGNSTGASSARNSGGEGIEDRVAGILARNGPLSWEELLEETSGDVETRLDRALGALQEENRVQYSGRAGGYVLRDE